MSRERKIHKLIEEQNPQEKSRVWQKIKEKLPNNAKATVSGATAVFARQNQTFVWRIWMTAVAAGLAVLVVGVYAVAQGFPFFGTLKKVNENRYFTNQLYTEELTGMTMKEYAQEIGKDLLYFDWYAETDHLINYVWKENETKEIICFSEEMVDINTGCIVYLGVTEAHVTIEAFISMSKGHQAVVNAVEVCIQINADRAWVSFEYENFKYYMRIQEPMDESYVVALIEELLS